VPAIPLIVPQFHDRCVRCIILRSDAGAKRTAVRNHRPPRRRCTLSRESPCLAQATTVVAGGCEVHRTSGASAHLYRRADLSRRAERLREAGRAGGVPSRRERPSNRARSAGRVAGPRHGGLPRTQAGRRQTERDQVPKTPPRATFPPHPSPNLTPTARPLPHHHRSLNRALAVAEHSRPSRTSPWPRCTAAAGRRRLRF
jgi:hypothetical protein